MTADRAFKFLSVIVCLLLVLVSVPPIQGINVGMDTPLTKAYASFYGEAPGDNAGTSVDIAGDVNGDGFADLIIGSPNNHDALNHAGKVYLVLGKSSGLSLGVNLSLADASWRGEGVWDQAGNSVSSAGDVNGDGYDDLLIAAHYNASGGISSRGKVYIIFGKASGWAKNVSLSNADASFLGETRFDNAGDCVDSLGDVNGDGYDDIIIGARYNDEGGSSAGQAYIVFGKASGWNKDVNLSGADASFIGEAADNLAGYSVAGPGDLNGDHLDDILIGAPESSASKSFAGMVYVIFGKTSGWSMNVKLTSNNVDASYAPEADGDWAGNSVSGAGDVNGDGLKDFLVGSFYSDKGTFETGQAYVVLGKMNGWAKGVGLGTVAGSYRGEGMLNNAGYSVSSAGDVDGDGLDDFLIDAPGNPEPGATHKGQAYMIRGKAAGWAQNVVLNNVDASWWSEPTGSGLGQSMGGGSDVNGDGYDDLILGEAGGAGGGALSGGAFLISPDTNAKPASITSVNAYSDQGCTKLISFSKVNSTIFVQLAGSGGGNASRKDVIIVNVSSNESARTGIRLTLTETGLATGTFRGSFEIKDRTHSDYSWIAAKSGETVTIKSVDDGTKKFLLYVGGNIIKPVQDHTVATEDQPYDALYTGLGLYDELWNIKTNASWLHTGAANEISGTPDNGDVGQFWVKVNVSYHTSGYSEERNFTIQVLNTLPTFTTANRLTASEDSEYKEDYNSTDDGQGTVTWHLSTNATGWLKMDPQTGILNGTPSNSAVGKYRVNVSVDDGNGGGVFSEFILTVANTNDAPRILNDNVPNATEDTAYAVQYSFQDPDKADSHVWSLKTNASSWLSLDANSGLLSGTPKNEDVGKFWVNITIKDGIGASNSTNFTLTVANVNDLPSISSEPKVTANIYNQYEYQVVAVDVDVGDKLTYTLDNAPTGMTIDETSGLVQWVPIPSQKGEVQVVIKISDGTGSVTQQFTISVIEPSSWPPVTNLLSPTKGATIALSNPLLKWKGEDKDTTDVTYRVYLGTARALVSSLDSSTRIAQGVKNTSLPLDAPLTLGTSYYWTVLGNDGTNIGLCLDGVWSFNVSSTAKLNHGPVITSVPSKEALIGISYKYTMVATDEDSDVLSYQLVQGPTGMKIDGATGAINWKPTAGQLGPQSVKLLVSDSILTAEQSFVIQVAKPNNVPVISAITDQSAKVSKGFTYQIQATDADGDTLNYSLKQSPSGMTISGTGLISWKPLKGQTGDQTVTVEVSDGKNQTSATFKVNVKKAQTSPVLGGMLVPLILILVLVVVIVVILAVLMKRKKKAPAQAPISVAPAQVAPLQQMQQPPVPQDQGQYYQQSPQQDPGQYQYPPQDGTYQNQGPPYQPPTS
jgi:hypothetical protein